MTLRSSAARVLEVSRASVRPLVCDLVGVCGCGMIAYGAWLVYQPAGYIAAGVMLVIAAALGVRSAN